MSLISRGFTGRRRTGVDPSRVPPGQYVTDDFPVLSAGSTPRSPIAEWSFTIRGEVQEPVAWTWEEFQALAAEDVRVDIPLRHEVVEARHDLAWRLARHAACLPSRPRPST